MIFPFQNFLWDFFHPRGKPHQPGDSTLTTHCEPRKLAVGYDPHQIGEYFDLMGFNGNIIYRLGFEYDLPSGYDWRFAMERSTMLLRTVNHLFLWAIYTMAM